MTWSTNQLKSTLTLSCRHPQLSLVGFRWRRKHRCHAGAYRWTHRHTVTRSACRPRSASNSSTSRYEREKRKCHPTASRMTCGSNCRHLNRPQTEDARRSIQSAYHGVTAKLQHFPLHDVRDNGCGRDCAHRQLGQTGPEELSGSRDVLACV